MKRISLLLIAAIFSMPLISHAGWQDFLGDLLGDSSETEQTSANTNDARTPFTSADLALAMKDALRQGVDIAIQQLGKDGGFLNDANVRIPMPEQLTWAEQGLRTLKQDALADAFVESMNSAAEQAVPEATSIFLKAIRKMSPADVQQIIQGPEDAATQYFRTHSEEQLKNRLKPLIADATSQVGVTSYYKQMVDKASFLQPFMDTESLDIDNYVTEKTLDGLFLKIAEEEQRIRENPLQRGTDIMKQVFNYYMK